MVTQNKNLDPCAFLFRKSMWIRMQVTHFSYECA